MVCAELFGNGIAAMASNMKCSQIMNALLPFSTNNKLKIEKRNFVVQEKVVDEKSVQVRLTARDYGKITPFVATHLTSCNRHDALPSMSITVRDDDKAVSSYSRSCSSDVLFRTYITHAAISVPRSLRGNGDNTMDGKVGRAGG